MKKKQIGRSLESCLPKLEDGPILESWDRWEKAKQKKRK